MAAVLKAFMGGPHALQQQPMTNKGEPRKIIIRGKAQLQEFLTCKVCVKRYSTSADGLKLPRELDCGHVFCHQCLTSCLKPIKNKHVISCPVCKQKTTLSSNDVTDLPVNRQMLGLIKQAGGESSRSNHRHHGNCRHNHNHSHSHSRHSDKNEEKEPEIEVIETVSDKPIKPALKKVTMKTEGDKIQASSTGVVVQQGYRLHPPPPGSSLHAAAAAAILAETTTSETNGSEIASLCESSGTVSISSAGSRSQPMSRYPVGELQDLAPAGFLNGDSGEVEGSELPDLDGVFGGVDYLASLTDLLHMQPTCATYMSSFGKFSPDDCEPGLFKEPTKISCSEENRLVIVDPGNDSIHVFSPTGECETFFIVKYLTGACFINETTLAVSSGRGVELYSTYGKLICTIPLGRTVAVARYKNGFVAALQTHLAVAVNPTSASKIHKISGARSQISGLSKEERTRPFQGICDVAVGISDEFIVADSQGVVVVDYNGQLLTTISPGSLLASELPGEVIQAVSKHGAHLFQPYAVACDPNSGQIIVSDSENRYISAFANPGGGFVRCLVNLRDQVANENIRAYGVTVNNSGQLFMVLCDDNIAETAFYSI